MESIGLGRVVELRSEQVASPGIHELSREASQDGELMERVAAGDQRAFGQLIDRHKDALVNYLTRLCGTRERAEDLAQDTFLRLYQKAFCYADRGRFQAYLYRIATNLLRSQQRREGRWRLLRRDLEAGDGEGSGGFTSPPPSSPRARLLGEELQRQVAAAITELPMRFRVPLVLHEIEGWAYRDIASLLRCREGTVKSRVHRARQKLKEGLASYWKTCNPAPTESGAREYGGAP